MNANILQGQKLDYDHFQNLGFTKSHVDLAYSRLKTFDPATLINWMLDNPEEKMKSKLEFLKFSQELEAKMKAKQLLVDSLNKPQPTLISPPILLGSFQKPTSELLIHKPNPLTESKAFETKKTEHVQSVLHSITTTQSATESLPLKEAKEEILEKVVNAVNKNYNIWLRNLRDIIEKVKSEGFKYKTLVEEMKKKSHREISKLLHCLFGSITLILQRAITDTGEFKELDLHSFFDIMNVIYDMGTFTKAQRKCIIAQYETYCERREVKANKLFTERILELGYFEKKQSAEEIQKDSEEISKKTEVDYATMDIDVDNVDDNTKEILLNDSWFESIEKEIEAIKNAKIEKDAKEANEFARKLKDLNLPEKQFTGQVLESGLTDREACVMCSQKMRAFMYMPCKHFLTCQDCTNLFKDCPVCQKPIAQKILLYWS